MFYESKLFTPLQDKWGVVMSFYSNACVNTGGGVNTVGVYASDGETHLRAVRWLGNGTRDISGWYKTTGDFRNALQIEISVRQPNLWLRRLQFKRNLPYHWKAHLSM